MITKSNIVETVAAKTGLKRRTRKLPSTKPSPPSPQHLLTVKRFRLPASEHSKSKSVPPASAVTLSQARTSKFPLLSAFPFPPARTLRKALTSNFPAQDEISFPLSAGKPFLGGGR